MNAHRRFLIPVLAAAFVTNASLAQTPGGFSAKNGFSKQSLSIGGNSRVVDLFVPAKRGVAPPLVIAFHGTSGEPEDWIDPSGGNDLETLASQNGFIVAAPRARDWGEGFSDWDNHGGNDRFWETRFDSNPSRGADVNANADLILVKQIIAAAHAAFNSDLKRVYLIGFSNGGFFATHAAMALRDQIAAFAEADSGLVTCDRTDSCTYQSSGTSCPAILASAPAACSSCKGPEKPIAIPAAGRKVPGLLGHRNRDDGVSVFYTCSLASRMQALGYEASVMITNEAEHGIPAGFLDAAWAFFSKKSIP